MQGTTTSEPLGGGPRRHRRHLWRIVVGLFALAFALAVFAWPQGGGGEGSLNVIAEAAEKTQTEPNGRAAMHATVSSPVRSESFTMTGQMTFDETGRSQAVMTLPDPESEGSVEMQAVADGTDVYMRSELFGSLPGGREWMAFDVSLGEELDLSVPANGAAKGELELLEAATGKVQELGREDVRGVPTTHYRGTVGVSENAERLREEGAEDLASYVEKEGTPLQVEAWIDAEGRLRRMRFVNSQPREEGEGSETIDMRIDFFDFGPVPEIEVPEASEVFDATALARDELGLSDDE